MDTAATEARTGWLSLCLAAIVYSVASSFKTKSPGWWPAVVLVVVLLLVATVPAVTVSSYSPAERLRAAVQKARSSCVPSVSCEVVPSTITPR